MRVSLKKLADQLGGEWWIPGIGKVRIVDYHPSTIYIANMRGRRYCVPRYVLLRDGTPMVGEFNAKG